MKLKTLAKELNYLKEIGGQKGDYTAIEQGWDGLSADEQINIIGDAMNGEPRPNDYEKGFDQLKSEIPDFESAIANYLGIDEISGKNYEVVTKDTWNQMDQKQREDALLTIFKDPDDITDEMLKGSWEDVTDNGSGTGHFNTGFDMQVQEGTCGYAPNGEVDVNNTDRMTPAGPDLIGKIREVIKAEIKKHLTK